MSKKLKIIGPYTPEHKGPFCTRDGLKARIICLDRVGDWPIVALVSDGEAETVRMYSDLGRYSSHAYHAFDLMNAEEIEEADQPRDFWVNEYLWGMGTLRDSFQDAIQSKDAFGYIRTIHVREVTPGEDA